MSGTLAGVPYWEIEFDKKGRLTADGGLGDVAGVRDLFVLAHGWNSSEKGARRLYASLFTLLAGAITPEQRAGCGFVGVLWPSLLFPEDGPPQDGQAPAGTGAQLAASLAPAFPGQEPEIARLGALLDERPAEPAQLEEFAKTAQSLVTTRPSGGQEDNGEQALVEASPATALGAMAAPNGVHGDAQADNLFTRGWHQARELLRTASYYEMKNRAGVVGAKGLGPLVAGLPPGVRVHLVGHSFGARLVAFSLTGLGSRTVSSVTFVQGAFSHFAFSPQKPGALERIANRVDGPMVATFSDHDRAVGTWYPAASFVARQDDQGEDDATYRWGAMGHDGFQQDGAVELVLGAPGFAYGFAPGGVYRLDGNDVIRKDQSSFSGAHCDIEHPEVAWAIVSAAGLGT